MIDIITATPANTQYGPIIIWILGIAIPLGASYFIWSTATMYKHTTLLAVIAEHDKATDKDILDSKKAHDEIIDLKLATSELDTTTKTHTRQLTWLIDRANNEIDEEHNTIERMRNK